MRVITWNMGYWQYARYHDEAWSYMVNEIKPDIALLQEVRPPSSFENNKPLYNAIDDTRGWGSAIYTGSLPIREIPIKKHRGWVAAGEILLPDNSIIVVVSIHARFIQPERNELTFHPRGLNACYNASRPVNSSVRPMILIWRNLN